MAQRTPSELNPFAKSPTTRTRYIPPLDNALRSSFEALKKELRLAERARTAGAENLPSVNDQDIDEAQRQVVSAIHAGVNLLMQFDASQMHSAEAKIKSLGLRGIDTDLSLARAAAEAAKSKQSAAEQLEEARLKERLRLRGWRKFRRDNGLTRKADYADAIAWPWVITGGMVVADAAVNAGLYMGGTDGGLAAGAGMAALFSAINVALGFGAGFFGLRLLGHVKALAKLVGGALFALLFGGGVFWNMVVAKYRDDLAHGGAGGFLDSATGASNGGWVGHASPEALGLMFLGGLIFLFAILKGRGGHTGFVDSYWHYKAVDIDHRLAEEAYNSQKEAYRAAVSAAYQQTAKEVRDLHAANEADLTAVRATANEADERLVEVRDFIGEWIRDGGAALRFYREENLAVRTLVAPAYFDVFPSFDGMANGLVDAGEVRKACEAAVAAHEKAGANLVAFEREFTRQSEAETKRFLGEVAEIEARAEARLARDFSDHSRPIDDLEVAKLATPAEASPTPASHAPAPAGAPLN